MLNNHKGSAMIVTLMVVLVITVLGFALWSYSTSEVRFTEIDANKMRAHYLARSGAEIVANYMIINSTGTLVSSITPDSSYLSEPTALGDGSFVVSINMNADGDEVTIESTGTVNGIDDRVVLTMAKRTRTFSELFQRAIFSSGNLDISHVNAYVYGDVESNGQITGEPRSGQKYEYSTESFNPPLFPDPGTLFTLANINTNSDHSIDQSNYADQEGIYINSVNIGPQGKLTINVPEDDYLVMMVNTYINKGLFEIEGGGRVLLFITQSAEMKTPHSASSDSLIVFMAPDTVFTLMSGGEFNGYLYGPQAVTIIQSHGTVRGSLITGGLYGRNMARFVGIVEHQVRENLDMSTIGEYIQVNDRYEKVLYSK
jgi:hypothetical protein